MKPRFEPISYEVKKMLEKAEQLNNRIDLLEKGNMAEKNKYCMKNFGKKYSECSEKQKAQCDKAHGKVEKGKDCPDCKNNDCPTCKMEKGEKCPSCGEKMEKGACMKMGCGGKMEKADPLADPKPLPKEKITDINPHLVTESGGQTKTSYYTTNGNTIEYEDGKPKRAKHDKKVDLGKLGGRMNPHAGTGAEREDAEGGTERRY